MSKSNQGQKPQSQSSSAQPSAQEPQSQKPQSAPAKPAKQTQQVDPFWLRTVFPNAADIFGVIVPPVTDLFADAIFAFDANALLAPYQVGKESAAEIGKIYRELASKNRIFAPEQAAREFGKNRGMKLAEMYEQVHKLATRVPALEHLNCPMLEGLSAYDKLSDTIDSIKPLAKEYGKLVNSLKDSLADWGWNDQISKLYQEIFTPQRLVAHVESDERVLTELERRYTNKVPPGYKDQAKPDSGIGDLLIWYSILKLGVDQKKSVIFVCNDTKHDWVYRSSEKALIPRLELSHEFFRSTGHHFGLMQWSQFLEFSGADPETIKQAEFTYVSSMKKYQTTTKCHALRPHLDEISRWLKQISTSDRTGPYAYSRLRALIADFRNKWSQMKNPVTEIVGDPELDKIDGSLQLIDAVLADAGFLDELTANGTTRATFVALTDDFHRHYEAFSNATHTIFVWDET